jgi:magnesium chelatase family protein
MAQRRHQQRLSGPLMDRIDLRIQVDPVPRADLFDTSVAREPSRDVARRVATARAAAARRWQGTPWDVNGSVPGSLLRSVPWLLPRSVLRPAESFLERGSLSARGFDRVLRIAWTIADLAGRVSPQAADVAEALYYRTGRAESWAA